ncbi:MAG: hypothetical protein AABX10_03430, partial [Nanoarchaeota archaeon]
MSNTQLDKRYGNDWAKSKSRDLVRGMVQRNLGYKKPQDLKVLCFPGNEAAEVREVYDPLGIPRGNIIGVERDKDVADKIRAQNLGIQVVNQTLEDYVASQNSLDFDVVSLDYSGPLSIDEMVLLGQISKKQGKSNFLLHVANLAKRDREVYDYYVAIRGLQLGQQPIHLLTAHNLSHENINTTLSSFSDYAQSLNLAIEQLRKEVELDSNLTDHRKKAYSLLVRSGLVGSHTKRFEEATRRLGSLVGMPVDATDMVSLVSSYNLIAARLAPKLTNLLKDQRTAISIASLLPRSLMSDKVWSFKDMDSYSYVSESGDPMVGDIYFVKSHPEIFEICRELRRGFFIEGNRMFLKNKTKLEGVTRRLENHLDELQEVFGLDFSMQKIMGKERKFLGSSALPVLTKQRAIEEFRAGASVEDLKDRYRGVNGKPLAQWKAHVTMGTYNDSPRSEEVIVEDIEDADTEKITKEQAIEFLSNGIPPKEIADAYPTSFTKGQLAAFKA